MEEEPAKTKQSTGQYSETAGSLLRTGVGVRPHAASRIFDKPYQQKSNTDDSSYGEYHNSGAAKEQPWDYYGIGQSKTAHQNLEAADDEEGPAQEEDTETEPTASQESFQDSGQDFKQSNCFLCAWNNVTPLTDTFAFFLQFLQQAFKTKADLQYLGLHSLEQFSA